MAKSKAKKSEATETAMISDMEKVFRYSGLSDKVAEKAAMLVQTPGVHSERGEVHLAVSTYMWLRDQIAAHLRSDLAEEMLTVAPSLDPETARIDEVFFAADNLSTYAQLIYDTPKFRLSEQAQALGMREVMLKISKGEVAFEEQAGEDALEGVPHAGLGQYL